MGDVGQIITLNLTDSEANALHAIVAQSIHSGTLAKKTERNLTQVKKRLASAISGGRVDRSKADVNGR